MDAQLDCIDAIESILASTKLPATKAKLAELAKALIFLNEAGIPALVESNPSIGAATLATDIEALKKSLKRIRDHLAKAPLRYAVDIAVGDLAASAQDASPSSPPSLVQFLKTAHVIEQALSHFLRLKSDHAESDNKKLVGSWAMKSLGDSLIAERYHRRQQLEAMFSYNDHRAVPTAIVELLATLFEQSFEQEFTAYKDRASGEYRGDGLEFTCAVVDAFGLYGLFDSDRDEIRGRVCGIWSNGASDRKEQDEAEAHLSPEERNRLRNIHISDQELPRDASQTD